MDTITGRSGRSDALVGNLSLSTMQNYTHGCIVGKHPREPLHVSIRSSSGHVRHQMNSVTMTLDKAASRTMFEHNQLK